MKTMKGWALGILLSLGLGPGFTPSSNAQDVGKTRRLAILEWPDATTPQGKRPKDAALTDLLTAELSASSGFELVERESLDAILREQSLALSSISKTEEAVRIGRLLKADWLLLLLQPTAATNAILSKLLDARTGVVLDLQMTPFVERDPSGAAKDIARHTTAARTQKIAMKDRLWIGFGGFEDLGAYRRYQDFGERLRTSLSLKYAGTKVSVVERSHIRPLLNELQLGLNGLAADKANTHDPQQAFVLVDGIYQAFHDERSKVNLVLRMEWISGRQTTVSIKEPPGADVERKVGEAIDRFLVEARNSVVTNSTIRRTEVDAQLKRGYELSHVSGGYYVPPDALLTPNFELHDKAPRMKEAIRAFESALFLDPNHLRAKFALAGCYVDSSINRVEDARDIWREIAAMTTSEKARFAARSALAASYFETDKEQALELLTSLRKATTTRQEQLSLNTRLRIVRTRLSSEGKLSPTDLIEAGIETWHLTCQTLSEKLANGNSPGLRHAFRDPPSEFYYAFTGGNSVQARIEFIGTVVSNLASEFPRLEPYLVASHVTRAGAGPYWLERYERILSDFARDPSKFAEPRIFTSELIDNFQSLVRSRSSPLAERVAKALTSHGEHYFEHALARDSFYSLLGQLYTQTDRWTEATAAFQSIGNRAVDSTVLFDIWKKETVLSGIEAANLCRQQMQLQAGGSQQTSSSVLKPFKVFPGEEICFAIEKNEMWLGDRNSYYRYDLHQDELKNLAPPINLRVRKIIIHAGKVWVATAEGLYGWNPLDGSVLTNGIENGLLMPSVVSLEKDSDKLWIGFGVSKSGSSSGGIGYLNLPSNRYVGMMADLPETRSAARSKVYSSSGGNELIHGRFVAALAKGFDESLWALASRRLLRHDLKTGKWETAIPEFSGAIPASLITTGDEIVIPSYEVSMRSTGFTNYGGLFVYNVRTKTSRRYTSADGLPNNNIYAASVDHRKLWLGGEHFLALQNLDSGKLEKTFTLPSSQAVTSMAIHGDTLWFSAGPALYRVPLSGDLNQVRLASRGVVGDDAKKKVNTLQEARETTKKMQEVYRVYKNKDCDEYKDLESNYRNFLRREARQFPLLEPTRRKGTNQFIELLTNKEGKGYDGFRFKCTLSEAADLGWIFAHQSGSSFANWFILPMEDQKWEGFVDFQRPRIAYTNAPWSGSTTRFEPLIQFLSDGQLQPGKEYFVWMSFNNKQPSRMYLAFDLLPATPRQRSRNILEGLFHLSGPPIPNAY